jgi:Na+-transporting NADH:ubiquinone oxidoreductase subunit NqrC
MDSEASRFQLARQGAQLEEIAKNVEKLVDLSEKIARMQEREQDRDERIRALCIRADTAADERKSLDLRLGATTAWARGVLAVVTAIILPVSGAMLWEVMHDIPAIERRVQTLEITTKAGTK